MHSTTFTQSNRASQVVFLSVSVVRFVNIIMDIIMDIITLSVSASFKQPTLGALRCSFEGACVSPLHMKVRCPAFEPFN